MMKTCSKIITIFLLIFLATTSLAKTVKVTAFRFSTVSDKTRLVFDITNPVDYKITTFQKRIVLDLKRTELVAKIDKKNLTKTPIRSISTTRYNDNLRVVLNLKNQVKAKYFLLKKPNRLVLDLYPQKNLVAPTLKTKTKSTAKNNKSAKKTVSAPVKKSAKKTDKKEKQKKIVIVIDPGHGGKQSGAVGCRGTLEKNITLAIAKNLQKSINSIRGFRAILTRKGDHYIPLRRRLSIARKYKADMFISIHADAYIHSRAHGASVFALSQRGATSEAARWLAKKENESELGQVISDKNAMLRSVLLDLAQTATTSASLDIGKKVLQQLSKVSDLHSRKVEQAAFVVLKAPDIPSLLVEVGFLSHRKEESKLRSSAYRKKIASQIAKGIKVYFTKRPPLGTYLAKMK